MDYLNEYKRQIGGTPIPLMQVMGNSIFEKRFNNRAVEVYAYCIENNKTWQEVLGFKYNEEVLY